MRLVAHAPQPVSEGGRPGEFLEIQYGAQRLIILYVTNLIQVKAAFVLHQDECLDKFRRLIPAITFRRGKVMINAFGEAQGVH